MHTVHSWAHAITVAICENLTQIKATLPLNCSKLNFPYFSVPNSRVKKLSKPCSGHVYKSEMVWLKIWITLENCNGLYSTNSVHDSLVEPAPLTAAPCARVYGARPCTVHTAVLAPNAAPINQLTFRTRGRNGYFETIINIKNILLPEESSTWVAANSSIMQVRGCRPSTHRTAGGQLLRQALHREQLEVSCLDKPVEENSWSSAAYTGGVQRPAGGQQLRQALQREQLEVSCLDRPCTENSWRSAA